VCPGSDGDWNLGNNVVCPVNVITQPEATLPDIQTTSRALTLLDELEASAEKPFLLAVGLHKPHIPLKYPEEFNGESDTACRLQILCLHACVSACLHVFLRVFACVCMLMCVCAPVFVSVCVCISIQPRMHTGMSLYVHVQMCS
jgi:hypothetical protein